MLLLAVPGGCSRHRVRERGEIARVGGYTLGLVVFGDDDAASPADRSARYIIEPGGVFRASFGGGSDALTYPPITRRLSEEQVDSVWTIVDHIETGKSPWRVVAAPELFHAESGSTRAFLLELGDADESRAWSVPIENADARALADHLAALAWARD